ncbi:MAG: histidine kinase [Bacteroidales bacterium]|nr:histidine kinase [Bacteroidales bacterium]
MKQISLLFIGILLLFGFCLQAQEFSYKHYTVQDGLVQSQVMAVFQDSRGYIWAGTKGGVSRFDGSAFVNITAREGLLGNLIENIIEDHRGRIWFLSVEGLSCYDQEKITTYPTDLFKGGTGLGMLYESKPDEIRIFYGNNKHQAIVVDFKDGQFEQVACYFPEADLPNDKYSFTYTYDLNEKVVWMLSAYYGLFKITDLNIERIPCEMKVYQAINMGNDNRLYLMADNKVYYISDNKLHEVFTNSFAFETEISHQFAVDSHGTVHFYNFGLKELHYYQHGKVHRDHYEFNGITYLYVDQQDNLWIGSEKGLFRLISKAFTNFIPLHCGINGLIWSISEDKKGNIWFASYEQGLCYWDGTRIISEESYKKATGKARFNFYMGSTIDHEKNILYTTTDFGGLKYDGKAFSKLYDGDLLLSSLYLFEDPDNFDLYFGAGIGLVRKTPDGRVEDLDLHPGNGRSRSTVCIIKDKQKRLWFGGFKGLSIMEGDNVYHLPTNEMPYDKGANAMVSDHKQNIWLGNVEGLYFYDFTTFRQVKAPGLDQFITSLVMMGDTAMLIGTVKGLVCLDVKMWYNEGKASTKVFTREDGFHGIEPGQHGIFEDSKGYFWIAASDRVVRFDPKMYRRNAYAPITYVNQLSYLNKQMDWVKSDPAKDETGNYLFDYTQKNLRFDFVGINTTNPEEITYTHKLDGYDAGWSEPNSEKYAIYTNLPPGNYTLLLKSCNNDGVWNNEPESLRFRIVPAIWQRNWFWLLLVLVSALLFAYLGTLFNSRRKRIQHKQFETDKKMAQLQLLALKNQIDPHFTYNAINSIASVVLKEEKTIAYNYFVKLSQLMRSIMNSSEKLTRSLNQEIAFVSDYLEIQRFRYKDRFDFGINISPEIDMESQLPKMTIQTFVENALKHGLLHLEGKGMLSICITKADGSLQIEIEDNGIGREKARQIGQHSTGKGLQILRGYFDYYNQFNAEKIKWEITDLKDDNGEAAGTHVLVIIPESFSFEV